MAISHFTLATTFNPVKKYFLSAFNVFALSSVSVLASAGDGAGDPI